MSHPQEVPVRWSHAASVWWSLAWRSLLLSTPVAFVTGLGLELSLGAVGIGEHERTAASLVAGTLLGCAVSVGVVKAVLTRRRGRYHLVLLEADPDRGTESAEHPFE